MAKKGKSIKVNKEYGTERIVEGGDKYYFEEDDGKRTPLHDNSRDVDVFRRGNLKEAVKSIWPRGKK